MKKIALLDNGDFSFLDEKNKPLGGAQSAFIGLVKGLSIIGNEVHVRNFCDEEFESKSIFWKRLNFNESIDADLYIINRSASLLKLVPSNKPTLFWLHNRGNYLLRPKNFKYLIKNFPTLIFSGNYHRSTFYLWPFFKNRVIPYGLNDVFFGNKLEKSPPPPRAIFSSNPLRSLDWLVDRWVEIQKRVPKAELHVFSGPSPYGNWGRSVEKKMSLAIQYARKFKDSGIFIHDPISKEELRKEIQNSRLMLYRGDKAETFCLAIAESLELGIPCVTMNFGSMNERIKNGLYGYVLKSDEDFVERAVDLLTKDQLWKDFHHNLLNSPVNKTWEHVAKQFIYKLK